MGAIVGQNKVLITILVENELFPDLLSLGFFFIKTTPVSEPIEVFLLKKHIPVCS